MTSLLTKVVNTILSKVFYQNRGNILSFDNLTMFSPQLLLFRRVRPRGRGGLQLTLDKSETVDYIYKISDSH